MTLAKNAANTLLHMRVLYAGKPWNGLYDMPSHFKGLACSLQGGLRPVTSKSARVTSLSACVCRGVLLYGPPGCSKTSLVRAAASESGATLLSLSGWWL